MGLIEVGTKGRLRLLRGAFSDTNYQHRLERLSAMRHDADTTREMFLLVRMFDRIEDPEKLVEIVKERNRLSSQLLKQAEEIQTERSKVFELEWRVRELSEGTGQI